MVRRDFSISEMDLKAAKRCASDSRMSLSEFIRGAVITRVEGTTNLESIQEVKQEMLKLMHGHQVDTIRARAEMLEDTDRSIQIFRQEVGENLRRNEELMKAFIRALGKQIELSLPERTNGPRTDDGGDWFPPVTPKKR